MRFLKLSNINIVSAGVYVQHTDVFRIFCVDLLFDNVLERVSFLFISVQRTKEEDQRGKPCTTCCAAAGRQKVDAKLNQC